MSEPDGTLFDLHFTIGVFEVAKGHRLPNGGNLDEPALARSLHASLQFSQSTVTSEPIA